MPDEVLDLYRALRSPRGQALRAEWEERLAAWTGDRAAWDAAWAGRALDRLGGQAARPSRPGQQVATRKAINACVNATADVMPGLVAGRGRPDRQHRHAARRTPSPSRPSTPAAASSTSASASTAWAAVMTGMACHGGVLPVGGTFFVFSDYMRGAVRLAALSQAHVIYSWTHDSVGLGQDGPTHQPIEQLASLRAMPGLPVIRPADANETRPGLAAGRRRRRAHRPGPEPAGRCRCSTATAEPGAEGVARGGYVLVDETGGAARRRPDRHRQRGARSAWTPPSCWPPRASRARVVSLPVLGVVRGPGRGLPRRRCCRPASPACRSRRPPPSAGTATPTTRWPSTPSAPRPPARWRWPSSASPPRTWPTGPLRPASSRCRLTEPTRRHA